MKQVVEL